MLPVDLEDDPAFVSLEEETAVTASIVDGFVRLDGDGGADEAPELSRAAQRAFDAGTRQLQGVRPRHRIDRVERVEHGPVGLRQRVEVDAAVAVNAEPQRAGPAGSDDLYVNELQTERRQDRLGGGSYRILVSHRVTSLVFSRKNVGSRPRPRSLG